jgi:LmbE family N-acetylglucosaminyl deacetylase
MVSVPHPNDHHPDHSASWFAIQLACQNVGLHPTLICPIDAYAMDLPLRWVPELRFRVEKHSPSKNDWLEIELSSEEHSLKKAMIDCYPSQMAWEHPWQTSAQLSTRSYLYGYLAQNELYALPTQVQEDRVWSAELSQKIFKKRLLHFLRGLFLLKSLPKE